MSSVNDCFVKFSHHSKKGLHLGEKFQNRLFYKLHSKKSPNLILALVHEYLAQHLALSENFRNRTTGEIPTKPLKHFYSREKLKLKRRRWNTHCRAPCKIQEKEKNLYRHSPIFFPNMFHLFIYFEFFYLIFPDLHHLFLSFQNFLQQPIDISCDTKYCFKVKDNKVTEYLRPQCLPPRAVITQGICTVANQHGDSLIISSKFYNYQIYKSYLQSTV